MQQDGSNPEGLFFGAISASCRRVEQALESRACGSLRGDAESLLMMKFRLLISILLLSLILPSCNPNKTAAGRMDRAEEAINTAPEQLPIDCIYNDVMSQVEVQFKNVIDGATSAGCDASICRYNSRLTSL